MKTPFCHISVQEIAARKPQLSRGMDNSSCWVAAVLVCNGWVEEDAVALAHTFNYCGAGMHLLSEDAWMQIVGDYKLARKFYKRLDKYKPRQSVIMGNLEANKLAYGY